jgi:hypothetical protein
MTGRPPPREQAGQRHDRIFEPNTLEILGLNAGVALSIPGGIFEIAFGALLIAKGFPEEQTRDHGGLARNVPPARTAPSSAPTA